MDIISKAEQMAKKAHAGQKRKTDGSPYIRHPRAVAEILRTAGFGDVAVAAGWVHDTVEDADVSLKDIERELGRSVAAIAAVLSEDKSLPWEERKQVYAKRLRSAPIIAKAVATADKIHNARDLLAYHQRIGPAIWSKFNRGREQKINFEKQVLAALKDGWQDPLLDEYTRLLDEIENLD